MGGVVGTGPRKAKKSQGPRSKKPRKAKVALGERPRKAKVEGAKSQGKPRKAKYAAKRRYRPFAASVKLLRRGSAAHKPILHHISRLWV